MQTLYIDVYFFINFTVDLLSIYYAAVFSKIKSTSKRLLFCSSVAALFACAIVLLRVNVYIFIILIALTVILITEIFAPRVTIQRKIKFFVSFLLFETFLGGAVSFLFSVFDKALYPYLEVSEYNSQNREFLIISIIVLLLYGALKLLHLMFSGTSVEKNVEAKICILGNIDTVSALVDSGNLLVDPMSGKPVIIVKDDSIKTIVKYNNITEYDNMLQAKIRLIPVKGIGGEKILTGIRSDYVSFDGGKTKLNDIVVAIDREKGNFGGYAAIVPSALVEKL